MPDFGPFSVEPAQVSGLGGANFGQFVVRLLATEAAAHAMAGAALETTYLENVGDGGVDAGLRSATGSTWLPPGASAWQFKAGNLSPAAAQAELEGASEAVKILQSGGSYRLVLGASLTSAKIDERRDALKAAVRNLKIDGAEDRVDVISADALARWIEQYPALAVSPLLRASGVIGQTYEGWSNSIRHATAWVSSQERDDVIASLRKTVESATQHDVHVDGVSGLGKTRLVLEALRGMPYEGIVVYCAAADSFPVSVLTQLEMQGRTAIVVIDECDRKQHEIYAQTLTRGTSLRLVTIGEPGGIATRTPMISLRAFGDEAMRELVRANKPSLSSEAERLVVEVAAGNIDYALKLADVAIARIARSAGQLVTEEDLRAFFTEDLPEGQLLLASCALALFSRFGLDGEPGKELDAIAAGTGLTSDELRSAAAILQQRGLLSKQGRYRAVGPHPVAVYLASNGWRLFGDRIVKTLIPTMDADLIDRLFRRATEIGEFEEASPAIAIALADAGPIASLESLAVAGNSALLVHLAILSPRAVSRRLASIVGSASEDDLTNAEGIRRDLVWALEKLAWHSVTFEQAAGSLLRLALAENETYSNNATGTWVELFGARLPGTAAAPAARIAYLVEVAASADARIRALTVDACARALDTHESIVVSGELQGGVIVESRGQPATWEELFAYRNSAIDLLGKLATDPDVEIARKATDKLVGSIHGLLEAAANREHLAQVIAVLPAQALQRARVEIEGLRTLFERAQVDDERPKALSLFADLLPSGTPLERLMVLANSKAWDREPGEMSKLLAHAAREVQPEDPGQVLVDLVTAGPSVPAAYSVGQALNVLGLGYDDATARLSSLAGTPNGEALVGFLHARMSEGETEIFDRFLEAADLSADVTLQFSVRGSRSATAMDRVTLLVPQVSVAQGARVLLGWMHEADQADSAAILRDWTARIETQADYNAAVDFAAMQLFRRAEPFPDLDAAITELVPLRAAFPEVGQESHDWSVLARRQLNPSPAALVDLLADLVEADALHAWDGSEESKLLQEALRLAGPESWTGLMERLERGEWRLSISVREWLGNAVDVHSAAKWVADRVERARLLAGVTDPGGSSLSPMAAFLIEEFGEDEQISSYLVGQFVSGMWSGNESDRIANQIAQAQGWISEPGQSAAVRAWAKDLLSYLEDRRQAVLQHEEERGW